MTGAPPRPRTTGSKAHRAWKCPASVVLPQCEDDDQEERSDPARRRGKAIHRYLERVREIGHDDALSEATVEHMGHDEAFLTLINALDLDALPVFLSTEVAFRYNWRTGLAIELGRNLDRAYDSTEHGPPGPDHIDLTIDIDGIEDRPDGRRGLASDYKSGHTKYPAPDRFAQTMLAAQCVRVVYGCVDVVVELIHIHDDGTHHSVRRIVDEWDLDAFVADFRASRELIDHWEAEYRAGRPLGLHEGPHCNYCPARKQCPAKVALVKSIPAELVAMGVESHSFDDQNGTPTTELQVRPGALTVRNAADAWMMVERIEGVLGEIKKQLCGIAWNESIPLPDGRVLGRQETERRKLIGPKAASVLAELYGQQEAMRALTITTSISAVRTLVVAHKQPKQKIETRKGDGALDLVLAQMAKAGAIETKPTEVVRPHVPKKKP